MNDFLKTLGQFGMEGLGVEDEGRELSLEEEMNEEIAMEASLDEAYAQMDYANMVAGASQAEAILTTMADREVGLESNTGRNATDVYKGFGIEVGMEAVKDVVARKAYSGLASIKALINTCIKWLKSLLGIQTASKKIFAGLKKKATAMKKQLSKVQSKVSEKLKREMPDYDKAINELVGSFSVIASKMTHIKEGTSNATSTAERFLNTSDEILEKATARFEQRISEMKESSEKLSDKDVYDKNDTTEYEGVTCYNKIVATVSLIATKSNENKSIDIQKIIDGSIKNLEKARKEIDKNKDVTPSPAVTRYLNKRIEFYTKLSQFQKKILKELVNASDDALTMAKGIYATLV